MKTNLISNTIAGLALASSLIAANANAVELDDFYVGGSVLQTYVDERGFDEDTTGGKLFAGYKFNQYLAIEASYYDFDAIEDPNNSLEIDGAGIGVVASYPATDRFSVFAKVGAHDWDSTARGEIANSLTQDSDTDVFYGVGAKFKLTENVFLHAEAERYEVEDIDLDVASVGFSFNF